MSDINISGLSVGDLALTAMNATLRPAAPTPITPSVAPSATPVPTGATASADRKPDAGMNPVIILLVIVGALWLFSAIVAAVIGGATKAAKATVYVGAAAAGLTVGAVEGAVQMVAARYAKCPRCLSTIRSGASVCRHCLRELPP